MENVKQKLLSFWNEIKYEACIFLYLFVRLIWNCPLNFISYISTSYSLNYSYGFIRRGLIGSIFDFVFDGDISFINAHTFVLTFCFVLITLISILFGKIIRSFEEPTKRKQIIFLVCTYLIMPFCVFYLFSRHNYGRQDLYLYIITILQILLVFKKPTLIKYLAVGVLSFICILIHEAYAFFVFPILFAILVYQIYKNNFDKKLLIGFGIILSIIGISTIYFNFFSSINVETCNELISALHSNTDLRIEESAIQFGYYDHTVADHVQEYVGEEWLQNFIGTIILLIIFLPINIFVYKIFKEYLTKRNKLQRNGIYLLLAVLIVFIPLFVVAVDWGRWFSGVYTYLFTLIVLMLYENQESGFEIINKLENFCKQNSLITIGIVLIFMALGPFRHIGIWEFTHVITALIENA